MPNRMISLERNTNETQIDLTLDLDGTGRYVRFDEDNARSEERRVGKECRSRWSPYH